MPKKLCFVCGKKKTRRLLTRIGYRHATYEPIFCSYRCAADFGLLTAAVSTDSDIHWCPFHGWYQGEATYDGCPHCVCQKHKMEEHLND